MDNKQISNKYRMMYYRGLKVRGTTVAGVVREGFSEEGTHELRPEGRERAGCGESMGKRIPGTRNSSCKGPSSGGNKSAQRG